MAFRSQIIHLYKTWMKNENTRVSKGVAFESHCIIHKCIYMQHILTLLLLALVNRILPYPFPSEPLPFPLVPTCLK